ncbi:MAG: hypothetical protein NZ898_08695 [Myxococcota bacterium]|nr:hypothetical protein [Myxococcota bacterium]MDW8363111.1 hypothetical protein [Myxococcales bacterium]
MRAGLALAVVCAGCSLDAHGLGAMRGAVDAAIEMPGLTDTSPELDAFADVGRDPPSDTPEAGEDAVSRDAGTDATARVDGGGPDADSCACEPGHEESRECGPCDGGVQERSCGLDCQWSPWSECTGDVACRKPDGCPGEMHEIVVSGMAMMDDPVEPPVIALECCSDGAWRPVGTCM